MRGVAGSILSAMAAAVVLGGCTTAAPRTEASGRSPGTRPGSSPGLVLHPLKPIAEADGVVFSPAGVAGGGWEDYRQDLALGVGAGSGRFYSEWIEVRTNDNRWNSNGRVQEQSRTSTRTVRRGFRPAD